MEGHKLFAIVLVFVRVTSGEVVRTQRCYLPAESQKSCTVHEVRVEPCPEAAEDMPCTVKLESNYSISFDYTPTFSATTVQSQVYEVKSFVDVPSDNIDTKGCLYTTCPVEANKRHVFTYSLEVGKFATEEVFQVKWKLWNKENPRQLCCFKLSFEFMDGCSGYK